jgi:hypothetical protein
MVSPNCNNRLTFIGLTDFGNQVVIDVPARDQKVRFASAAIPVNVIEVG